jgi:tRNA threonylcarbamoyl adenosine modification protein (Sua5/YciO/YrdC/YwlC family)
MKTIRTQSLSTAAAHLKQASSILQDGGLVAFPTETVYGLGADASNDHAVAKIYHAKGRPQFNPLIVHVADVQTARRFVQWSDLADQLAKAFWPGPLTLVLPRKKRGTPIGFAQCRFANHRHPGSQPSCGQSFTGKIWRRRCSAIGKPIGTD